MGIIFCDWKSVHCVADCDSLFDAVWIGESLCDEISFDALCPMGYLFRKDGDERSRRI